MAWIQVPKVVLALYLMTSLVSSFSVVDKKLAAHWSGWFNSDDPTVTGDHETVMHIRKYKGHKCSRSVPCRHPIAMDVEVIDYANETDNIMDCVNIGRQAMNYSEGFFCLNEDQVNYGASEACLEVCKTFGLANKEGTDCVRCPDFRVRYSCPLDTSLWDCDGDKPDLSGVGGEGVLGKDSFDTLNPDQQDITVQLVSLLQQLLTVMQGQP